MKRQLFPSSARSSKPPRALRTFNRRRQLGLLRGGAFLESPFSSSCSSLRRSSPIRPGYVATRLPRPTLKHRPRGNGGPTSWLIRPGLCPSRLSRWIGRTLRPHRLSSLRRPTGVASISQGVGTPLRVRPMAGLSNLSSPSTNVAAFACPPSAGIGGMRQPGCPTRNGGSVPERRYLKFLASHLDCRRQLKSYTVRLGYWCQLKCQAKYLGCRSHLKPKVRHQVHPMMSVCFGGSPRCALRA
jgi:hypothetical protein